MQRTNFRFAVIICHLLVFGSTNLDAQLGSWTILNGKLALDSSWQISVEGQLRSLSFYDQFHYYEYKTALTYSVSQNRSITGGIGSYRTFLPGGNFRTPAMVKEIRSWAEFTLFDPGRFLALEHRYRIEQRYTNNGFRNRFRYRIGGLIPLGKKSQFYLAGWEEVFLTNRAPYFERIRSSIVLGRKSSLMTIHAGFLHQFDYKINNEIKKVFFQLSMSFNFKRNKFKTNTLPFQEG